jgi:hypothetical protein
MNPSQTRTTRSAFLKYGAGGLATAGLAGAGLSRWSFPASAQTLDETGGFLHLFVNDGYAMMVDERLVYMRGFGEQATGLNQADPKRLTHPPRMFLATTDPVVGLQSPPLATHAAPERDQDPDRVRFPFDAEIPPLHDERDRDQPDRILVRRECPDIAAEDEREPISAKRFWQGYLHRIKRHTWTSF